MCSEAPSTLLSSKLAIYSCLWCVNNKSILAICPSRADKMSLLMHLKAMEDRKEGELHLELKAMLLNRYCFKICFSELLAGRC